MTNEELLTKIRNGEVELTAELWEQSKALITWHIVRFYKRFSARASQCGYTLEDLKQEGYIIFTHALEHADLEKGKFTTYLEYSTLAIINSCLKLNSRSSCNDPLLSASSIYKTVPGTEELTLSDTLPDETAEKDFSEVLESIYREQLREDLEAALCKLSENEADTLRQLYFEGKDYAQTAHDLNLQEAEIHKLRTSALARMRLNRSLIQYRADLIATYGYKGKNSTETTAMQLISLDERANDIEKWLEEHNRL